MRVPNSKCLCRHVREQEGCAAKQAYVRFTRAREKTAMELVENQRHAPFNTTEASLWHETIG